MNKKRFRIGMARYMQDGMTKAEAYEKMISLAHSDLALFHEYYQVTLKVAK